MEEYVTTKEINKTRCGRFEIKPDYDLIILKQGQDLHNVTARVFSGIRQTRYSFC